MDKVVVITGAGRGIGAATARLLGSQGYAVCINYVSNRDTAYQLMEQIVQDGGKAMTHQADVSDESQVNDLFDAAEHTFGNVTHLVNNAGILFEQCEFTDISAERFGKILQVNVLSAFLCAKAFICRSSAPEAIVNVSSAASRSGAPFEYVDYAASKGAMDSMTKGLAMELAARNIRVNGVRPGFIETSMHADGGEPDRVARLSPQIPLKRGGHAEEVAQAISWLLSDASSYVTGSFIDVAGGR